MRILAAMSGGVDSSVAAAIALAEGHHVVGATMKLWGGPSDSGCCSVADVDDARRVAQQLGIAHHVFNFSDEFSRAVVDRYVEGHRTGRTPNPCIECNRHLKFDRLLRRAEQLGFDAVATGHHARIGCSAGGRLALLRGADHAKDQSYVLHMLGQSELSRVMFPVGSRTKAEVRALAAELGLRTAGKPDSQDVCFITSTGGRESFLGDRIPLRPARVIDEGGHPIGRVPAMELVTVGQRRGLGSLEGGVQEKVAGGAGPPGGASVDKRRYVLAVDGDAATVTVGPLSALLVDEIVIDAVSWVDGPPSPAESLEVQMSAHGATVAARWWNDRSTVLVDRPVRRVAPGQSVVLYRGDAVVGGGTCA
jgi:tRNA-specific 2-thiouridylase